MQTLYERFPVSVYNYIRRKKELFFPLNPPDVGIYVCGPTVYGEPHLGHLRTALAFDVIYRYFNLLGYRVCYVRNITDVGHLEDVEHGEDKILKQAKREKRNPMEIAHHYTYRYSQALAQMQILPPSIEPRASGHIPEQIELIQKIMDRGYAYLADNTVYFNLARYLSEHSGGNAYGTLSGKVVDDLKTAVRNIKNVNSKKSTLDFALWKGEREDPRMSWNSPWGRGFPGWHLECTAMSTKYLGTQFDIHGGGLDLQFPHHEAEIAQNQAAFSCSPARYWLYSNLLQIDGQKMSKSQDNFVTLDQLLNSGGENAVSPSCLRFFMLRSHYRSQVNFSEAQLKDSAKGLEKLSAYNTVAVKLCSGGEVADSSASAGETAELSALQEGLYSAMSDDFNTPRLVAGMFTLGSLLQQAAENTAAPPTAAILQAATTYSSFYRSVLALQPEEEQKPQGGKQDALINLLLDLRNEARRNRNFQLADRIRAVLQESGLEIQDGAGKTP